MMETLDTSLIGGLNKCWIYQHFLLATFSWPFLVYDFCLSFTKELLDPLATRYLKSWLHLFRSADTGVLYRPRSHFGLNMSSPSSHFKKMQVVKCLIIKDSRDTDLHALYERREKRESKFVDAKHSVWRASQLTTKVEAMVAHDTLFAGQFNRAGLGAGTYQPNPSSEEYRKACIRRVAKLEYEDHWKHAHTLTMQGVWTHWFEYTHPLDFSWKTLIYGPGRQLISFLLNASINSLPTPDMRKLLGYTKSARCPICKAKQCTGFHILAGCPTALQTGRYTWRHDSVLATLQPRLLSHLRKCNSEKILPGLPPDISRNFVKSSSQKRKKITTFPRKSLLSNANDWELLVDFTDNQMVFPPFICVTAQRPDIVIFSRKLHLVILVELTCPAEENILAAQIRKEARYLDLQELIKTSTRGYWLSHLFTIEAGARGFVANSMRGFLRKIGFSPTQASSTCKEVSLIVAKCSHTIWLSHRNRVWPKTELLTPQPEPSISATNPVKSGAGAA